MYKVKFIKNVWDGKSQNSSSKFSIFKKELELNFVPVPGMKFNFGRRSSESPIDISWISEEQEFHCNMPDEFEHWKFDSHMNYKYNCQSLVDEGWEFVGDMDA